IFETIKNRLELPKQNNIKKALEDYEKRLLETRAKINAIKDEIKQEENKLPRDKKAIDTQESLEIKEKIETFKINQKELLKEMETPCYFLTKDGKKQIVRSLKLKTNSVTKADSIIITDKKQNNRVQRLDKEVYESLKESKTPFVAKLNDNTLSVDLYNTAKGQVIGLNYFSSIKSNILPKIDEGKIKLISNYDDKITVSKNDIIEIQDLKSGTKNYYTCNGGGEIGKGKNVLKVDNINIKNKSVIPIQIADYRIVKKAKINFFGEISYEEFKKN
ncbi:BAR domain-containing protein, partial [Aliarcobacter skirrowii]